MVVAVALIAILTASITSTFVEAAQRRHRAGQEAEERDSAEALHRQLEDVVARLTAIEAAVAHLPRVPIRRFRPRALHDGVAVRSRRRPFRCSKGVWSRSRARGTIT